MDDIIGALYGTHNDAGTLGIFAAAEKIASEFGEDGVVLFEQWLDQIPADAVYEFVDAEKTASEMGDELLEKVAEADFLGRIMYHAFQEEAEKHEKIAEYVGNSLYSAFIDAHTE